MNKQTRESPYNRKIEKEEMTSAHSISTKGWSWGGYELLQDEMEFQVDGQRAFGLKYKEIALSSANGKNEVALEFAEE